MQTPENIPLSVVEIKSPAWVDEIRSAVWVDEIRSAVRGVQTSSRIRTCSKSLKLGYFQIISNNLCPSDRIGVYFKFLFQSLMDFFSESKDIVHRLPMFIFTK